MAKKLKKVNVMLLFVGIFLLIYTIILLTLILWGVGTSLKNPTGKVNGFRGNELGLPKGWPWEWEWNNYSNVFSGLKVKQENEYEMYYVNLVGMIINTLAYTLGGALISTVTPCVVAYVVAKCKFKFNIVIEMIVILTMAIPVIGSYPSEIQVLRTLKIYDTWIGAAVQKMNFLGMYFLVFLATFKSIPDSYAESAYLDGAGEYRVMFRIIAPLAKNVILTVMLILFIQYWNDYQYPLLYLSSKPTLAYGVYDLVFVNPDNGMQNIPTKMAGSILLFLPILIIFMCFKDTLMKNLSMGGLKE